jgi:EAL domain-containing protein (putative c-di-GMP-specific phosphodiesterase class I)/GGDEF domain-containing protein
MGKSNGNMLGLVELTDAQHLIERHGTSSFNTLRDVYIERLKEWVRAKDQWRVLDNNRFCVILRDISSEGELELAAAKLGRLFEPPHYQFGRAIPLGVTAGFAPVMASGEDLKLATHRADLALRNARRCARLFDLYTPQCEGSAEDESKLVQALETAVERGELELYYQPKVHAGYRSLLGAEALVRWHTPDRRVISPEQFIAVAERNQVIGPMTWWAIKSAVARLARWPEQLSVSVNVSPALLMADEIQSVISDALAIHGVAPQRLCLEVTESLLVENPDLALYQLGRLSDLGVRISLDDFGTGFCSLSYFRDLPVDEVKIDKSFVSRMLESEKDHAIVKAVIDLAHNFSLQVVAEGVESMEIAERLGALGCDVLQGYVFDRPLPVNEFDREYALGKPRH